MNIKNPIFFFLFLIFILVNIIDIVTAYFILPAESNFIYLLTKSYMVLLLFKILLIVAIGYYYKRNIYPNNFTYYMLMSILVFGTFILVLACATNIYGIYNPSLVEESAKLTTQEKVSGYTMFVSIVYIIPMIFNLVIFWLYDKTHKYIIVSKIYNCK